jgi:hypothetical protein
MEEGQEVCDGVCVDTLNDNENCGGCNIVCNPNEGEFCIGGECQVILPYGAPMPEPTWI